MHPIGAFFLKLLDKSSKVIASTMAATHAANVTFNPELMRGLFCVVEVIIANLQCQIALALPVPSGISGGQYSPNIAVRDLTHRWRSLTSQTVEQPPQPSFASASNR